MSVLVILILWLYCFFAQVIGMRILMGVWVWNWFKEE